MCSKCTLISGEGYACVFIFLLIEQAFSFLPQNPTLPENSFISVMPYLYIYGYIIGYSPNSSIKSLST